MQSRFFRDLFPQTRLSGKQALGEFMTTQHGLRLSTSVGGVLTGRGADYIILDDVMKPEEALSQTRRNAGNEWFFSTLLSRLNSKENGVIILVMQRLHEDDLVGNLLAKEEHWEVLRLPAIAEEDERYPYTTIFGPQVFTRRSGAVLHPERDSLATLLAIKAAVGEYNFESQYQQSPQPLEGGIIKKRWLQFYDPIDLPEQFTMKIQSWTRPVRLPT